ncbi:MAG TPA: UvrD-helicase domain-containing protein, partial [Holophagaceae bacterium]
MTAFRVPKPRTFPTLDTPHWVVEASAGTGKTFTLEHLVVDLVLGAGLPLEQVVVVTFTDAAALELRRRIRAKLQELRDLAEDRFQEGAEHWTIDDAARTRLDAALQAFDRTVISTIHAFCQKVLQDAAFDAGRPFRQTRAAEEDLFADAFKDHLRTALAEDRAFLEAALEAFGSIDRLQARLLEAWKARATLLPEPDQLDRARAAVAAFPLEDLDRASDLEAAYGPRAFGPAAKRFAALRARLAALRDGDRLEDWKALGAMDLLDPSGSAVWLQRVWAWDLPEGPARRLREGLQRLAEARPSVAAAILHRLLPPLAEAIRRRKAAEGLFDFDDLIDQVAEGVRNPALVARLRERYRAALIDEFQDTDARQWEIFRAVFHAPEHRLVLVGDPKQAIYEFRGGDLPTYLAATRAVAEGGGRTLSLGDNFRSSPALLDAVNGVLAPEGGFFQPPNAYPVPVRPGLRETRLSDAQGDLPPLRLFEVEASGPIGPLRTRVAAGIAGAFRALLEAGATFHPGKDDAPPRPLHPGDFMVLTHTARESRQMARALREAGLPATFFKADGLFQTREALELRDLLRGLLRPEDPDARGRALLTRFFGFGLAEAEACLDLPAGHPVRGRLERWQELARARRYPRLFNALMDDSGLVPRLLVSERGDRALTNVRHLMEHLLAEATAAHLDPEDLLRRLEGWVEARDLPVASADPDLQRAEGETRAVRLLTIHKAKGLEAPVVALFGGYGEGLAAQATIQRFHDDLDTRCAFLGAREDAPPAWRERMAREAAREDERLLYVAMTRPQVQLVLPVFLPGTARGTTFEADGNPRGRHGALNRRLRAIREADPAA